MLVVRGGEPTVVTLSDRLRPPGEGFGVGWIHLFPSALTSETLQHAEAVACAAVQALGLRDGIAFPQLLATAEGEVLVIEVAARIAAGQMSDLVRYGTGIDLVEIALLQAVGKPVPDELVLPRAVQPLAIRFLTAEPGVLSPGRVTAIENLDAVLSAPGVVAAELYFGIGGVIRPVQVDDDRRGYVIATGETADDALVNAQRAAELLVVKTDQSPAWWEKPAV
jgi:biotin carboxylase